MRLKHGKTLITGKPGVGKTTLVQKIIKRMGSVNMAGFCTSEIRCTGSRLGFELQGLNGGPRILAHVEIDSQHRVGKYGVDKDGFEEFLATLDLLNPDVELIVIEEIKQRIDIQLLEVTHANRDRLPEAIVEGL
jgi:nucleoside-triphosphatase